MQTLETLAQALDGEFIGNAQQTIKQVAHPTTAKTAEDLALVLDKEILGALVQLNIQTALVPADLDVAGIPNQIKVKRPKVALAKLLDIFDKPVYIPPGVHATAVIDKTAVIAADVVIGPFCVVGPNTVIGAKTRLVSHVHVGADVQIGEQGLFYPGSVIGDRIRIGNRVILQANTSIGSDGFSYVTEEAGNVESARSSGDIKAQNSRILRINSIGTVVLEDDVEVGANACIDRATLGETRIGQGTKLDNQVQIAHNVTIGENCMIVSQVGIAGSAKIGDRVVIAGQAGIKDHTSIGDDSIILPKTGVSGDVPSKVIYMGFQGMPRKDFLRREMKIGQLASLPEKLSQLAERIEALEEQSV